MTATRSTPRTVVRPRHAERDAAAKSRAAVRPLPQETAGPRLRVFSTRRVTGRAVLTVGFALFFLLLAGSVAIQAQRIEAQHRIDQLEERIVAAEERNRSLRADVAVAESPDTVMTSARELGMVDPGPVQPLVPRVTPTTKVPVPGG